MAATFSDLVYEILCDTVRKYFTPPRAIVGGEHCVCGWAIRKSVVCLSGVRCPLTPISRDAIRSSGGI